MCALVPWYFAILLVRASAKPEPQVLSEYLGFFRDVLLNSFYNAHPSLVDGSKWPQGSKALTMAGQRRLDSFSALVATAVEDGVPGDVIETGVWRGGASFMAAKTLELLGERAAGRRTYLADSFQGIPDQAAYGASRFMTSAPPRTVASLKRTATSTQAEAKAAFELKRAFSKGYKDGNAHRLAILNENNVSRVRRDALQLGLEMSRLKFVVGCVGEGALRPHGWLRRHTRLVEEEAMSKRNIARMARCRTF